jgi:uncharacterized membrane protein YedE/YeeE
MMTTIGGIALGLLFGYVLQRGGYCMNTAFRSLFLEKDRSLVRAWVLILLINVVGVQLLRQLGVLQPLTAPFFWPAMAVGGLLFGAGMVLAGGCASGTYYRCGRGMIGSMGALAGFAVGATTANAGVLRPLQQALRAPTIGVNGEAATLFNVFGIESVLGQWLVIAVLGIPAAVWLLRAPQERFLVGWSWKRTGLLIGVLALLAWVLSAIGGRDYGISFTQPTVALVRFVLTGDASGISVASFIVVAVPVGALLAAISTKQAVLRLPEPGRMMRQVGGGLAMGVGAGIAGGCNIGHSVTGVSTLGIGSIAATLFIMLGCWAMTWIIYRAEMRAMQAEMQAQVSS